MAESILSETYNLELLKKTRNYSVRALTEDLGRLAQEYLTFIAYCDSLSNSVSRKRVFQKKEELADFLEVQGIRKAVDVSSGKMISTAELPGKTETSLLVAYIQQKGGHNQLILEKAEKDLAGLLQKQLYNPHFLWLQLELRARKPKPEEFNDFEYILVSSNNGRKGFFVRDIKASRLSRKYIERDPFNSEQKFS